MFRVSPAFGAGAGAEQPCDMEVGTSVREHHSVRGVDVLSRVESRVLLLLSRGRNTLIAQYSPILPWPSAVFYLSVYIPCSARILGLTSHIWG